MRWTGLRAFPAVQQGLPGDSGPAGGQEPQDRHNERCLPGAGLAHDAQRLPPLHLQGDVVDGVDVLAAGVVGYGYVPQ